MLAQTEEELRHEKEAKEKRRLELSQRPGTEGLDFDAVFTEMNAAPVEPKSSVRASNPVAAEHSYNQQPQLGSATGYTRPPVQSGVQPAPEIGRAHV